MATQDKEKLQAFAQKMQDEGAAGFASGVTPWETWDDFEDRVGSRARQGTAEDVAARELPKHSFGNRVITTMTVLAVVTLVIGVTGVYITQEPAFEIADNHAQLHSTTSSRTLKLQLPVQGSATDSWKADIALNNASIPPPVSGIRTIGTTEAPSSGVHLANKDNDTVVTELDTDSHMALAELNDLPAPAAGTPAVAAARTAPEPSVNETVSGPTLATTVDLQAGNPEITTADPVQPMQLSRVTLPDTRAEVLLPPKQDITQPKPIGKSGDWSINLASYTRESTAAKMKSRFLDKGVAADQVVATVNGKTYYRLRVTGFETRQAAMAESTGIKEKLGLEDIWITKK